MQSRMLCDSEIKELIENHGFIQNYNPASYADLPISAGISSVGYDLTLAASVYSITEPGTLDPLNFQEHSLTLLPVKKHNGRDVVFMPPKSVALAHSVEWFNFPANVTGQCVGKSTYARIGVDQFGTPLEPGWSGQVTIELVNHTNAEAILYIGMGILQVQFFSHKIPDVTYANKRGKYQNQSGVTPAR